MPQNQNPHQTVTRFGCVGFSMYACGFSMRQFYLFTRQEQNELHLHIYSISRMLPLKVKFNKLCKISFSNRFYSKRLGSEKIIFSTKYTKSLNSLPFPLTLGTRKQIPTNYLKITWITFFLTK